MLFRSGEANNLQETNMFLPMYEVKIKVGVNCYNFIESGKTDKISFDNAVSLIKQNTRNYAKRQMTWFRKDENIKWFSPIQRSDVINHLDLTINQAV